MSGDFVLLERDGPGAVLTLNRPERGNALGASLVEALHAAVDTCLADGARLIVIRGAGRHLSTGFDLDALDTQSDGDLLLRFVQIELLLQKIASAPALTMAVAHGRTTGAGADLFAACDIRMALCETTFAFPGAGFGVVLGSRRLAALIGPQAAQDVILGGRVMSAEEAAALRLVTGVVMQDALASCITAARARAARLEARTLGLVRNVTAPPRPEEDLAALVRSAGRPGLKARIIAHRERIRAARDRADERGNEKC